jgi:hypothetical protein
LMLLLLPMERAEVVPPKSSNADTIMVKQGKASMVSFIRRRLAASCNFGWVVLLPSLQWPATQVGDTRARR